MMILYDRSSQSLLLVLVESSGYSYALAVCIGVRAPARLMVADSDTY